MIQRTFSAHHDCYLVFFSRPIRKVWCQDRFFVKQVFFGLASKLPHAVAFCQAEASVDDKEQLAMPGSQVRQIPFESELEIDHSWNWKWTEFFLVVFQAFLNSDWWIIPVGSTLITRGSQIYGCATHKLTAASTLGRRLRQNIHNPNFNHSSLWSCLTIGIENWKVRAYHWQQKMPDVLGLSSSHVGLESPALTHIPEII